MKKLEQRKSKTLNKEVPGAPTRKLNEEKADVRLGERRHTFFLQGNKKKRNGSISKLQSEKLASTSLGITENNYPISKQTSKIRYPALYKTFGTTFTLREDDRKSPERRVRVFKGSVDYSKHYRDRLERS